MGINDAVEREQQVYAKWLAAGSQIGFALLVVTFAAYVFDVWEPHVPIEHLPRLWTLPAHEFRSVTDGPHGWEWIALLGRGDFLTYTGIAVLALTTVACYARIVPALATGGERLYAAIAIAQILVLLAAATGVVSGH